MIYYVLFAVLATAAASLELSKAADITKAAANAEFQRFRTNYLVVYSLMMGEWGSWRRRPRR